VGWVKLVYDHLPEREFTTNQVYENEPEFSRFYPENRTIRAKIRQQLQVLRDMGLIKHIGKSRWIKAGLV
jgi:type II restriction enzyme